MDPVWAGAWLRHIRTLAGRSLEEAAGAAGVSRGAVSNWENGRWIPGPEHVGKLATLYGMEPEELMVYADYPITRQPRSLREWYAEAHAENPVPPFGSTTRRRRDSAVTSPQHDAKRNPFHHVTHEIVRRHENIAVLVGL